MSRTVRELGDLARLNALIESGRARTIRTDAGLSLADFGGVLGVSKTTVLRWESPPPGGRPRRPRGRFAIRYLRLLQELEETRA